MHLVKIYRGLIIIAHGELKKVFVKNKWIESEDLIDLEERIDLALEN